MSNCKSYISISFLIIVVLYKGTCFLLHFKPVTENGRYGLGIDSASNRNEYQGYLLGLKAAGA